MKKLFAALLVATSAIPASATIFHYTLKDVTFNDGGTATGVFDWDTDHVIARNIDILTSGGVASNHYVGTVSAGSLSYGFDAVTDDGALLQLIVASPNNFMSGGTVSLGSQSFDSFEYYNSAFARRDIVSGFVTTEADVPEPAMIGLFGLGAIGLGLSRRRKS